MPFKTAHIHAIDYEIEIKNERRERNRSKNMGFLVYKINESFFLHERKKRKSYFGSYSNDHKQWYCYNVTSSQHNGIAIEIIVNILLWKKPLSSSFCVRNNSFDHLKFQHWPNNWLNSSFSVLYLVMYLATMEWNGCDSNVIALHSVAHLKYNRWW